MTHTPVFVRSPNNYDMMEVSNETGLECPEPTLTQQQFKEEADINTLVERFKLTGQIPEGVRQPTYGDFTGVKDYRQALHAIMEAEDSFMAMPAEVRYRFNNDAAAFVDFCSNPGNKDEIARMGLTKTPPPQQATTPAQASVTPTPGTGGGPAPAPAPAA